MKKIRTTIGVAALVVSTAACTPGQVAFWMNARAAVEATPDPADDIALQAAFEALPDTPQTSCAQWFWHAMEAGFTYDQWMYPLSGIMRKESMCNPGAHNGSGATGLTQVMPMWADDCGGVPADLYDPLFNLECAKHVYDVSGWGAWSTYPP